MPPRGAVWGCDSVLPQGYLGETLGMGLCLWGPELGACSVRALPPLLPPCLPPSLLPSLPHTAPRKMQFESSHFQLPRCGVLSPRGDRDLLCLPGMFGVFQEPRERAKGRELSAVPRSQWFRQTPGRARALGPRPAGRHVETPAPQGGGPEGPAESGPWSLSREPGSWGVSARERVQAYATDDGCASVYECESE